jgi:hypothetical protein
MNSLTNGDPYPQYTSPAYLYMWFALREHERADIKISYLTLSYLMARWNAYNNGIGS